MCKRGFTLTESAAVFTSRMCSFRAISFASRYSKFASSCLNFPYVECRVTKSECLLYFFFFANLIFLSASWRFKNEMHHRIFQVYLGNYPDAHFTDQPARDVQQVFKKELEEISSKIKERNKTLDIPYVYLLPEKVPNSVAQ